MSYVARKMKEMERSNNWIPCSMFTYISGMYNVRQLQSFVDYIRGKDKHEFDKKRGHFKFGVKVYQFTVYLL